MDTLHDTRQMPGFDEILADFAFLDDWEDRYRYVIELGRKLEPLAEAERSAANKVQGCVSQVWLSTKVEPDGTSPRLSFVGDSDAHIVRGLIAILFALYSGKTAQEIITGTVAKLPYPRTCECASALKYALVTRPDAIPDQVKKDLAPLVGKYLALTN